MLIDVPVTVILGTVWLMPNLAMNEQISASLCDPCDPSTVNAFDRPFIQFHDRAAGYVSDAFFYALVPFYAALQLSDYGVKSWRGYLTDTWVLAETIAASGRRGPVARGQLLIAGPARRRGRAH